MTGDRAGFVVAAKETFAGEDVTVSELGVIYHSRPLLLDDLTKIQGVGSAMEEKLHGFGVYRFQQIALWTQEVSDEFSRCLGLRGRIEREEWVEQARDLMKK